MPDWKKLFPDWKKLFPVETLQLLWEHLVSIAAALFLVRASAWLIDRMLDEGWLKITLHFVDDVCTVLLFILFGIGVIYRVGMGTFGGKTRSFVLP